MGVGNLSVVKFFRQFTAAEDNDPIGTIALRGTPQGEIIPYSVKAAMSVHRHRTNVKRIAYFIEEKTQYERSEVDSQGR